MTARTVAVLLSVGLASCRPSSTPVEPQAPPVASGNGPSSDTEPRVEDSARTLDPADRTILEGGKESMDQGEFEHAKRVAVALLDRYPGNPEVQRLLDDIEVAERRNQERLDAIEPKVLAPVAFRQQTVRTLELERSQRPPQLVVASKRRNEITDGAQWFLANDLSRPGLIVSNSHDGTSSNVPPFVPKALNDLSLVWVTADADHVIAAYGPDYAGGRVLLVMSNQGDIVASFDFSAWARSPKDVDADMQFSEQRIRWAMVRAGALFVSAGHNTYAKSSGGLTAFITAIDLETGDLLWRSAPVVSNANNFLYRDGYIISGYGFTAEPDFLFVLDGRTGRTVSKTRVKTGPDYIVEKDGQLFVRTYDTDYVFDIQ